MKEIFITQNFLVSSPGPDLVLVFNPLQFNSVYADSLFLQNQIHQVQRKTQVSVQGPGHGRYRTDRVVIQWTEGGLWWI